MDLLETNKNKGLNLPKDIEPMQLERELIRYIRLGVSFEESWTCVEELIDSFMSYHNMNFSLVKIRVMELIFILSRVVVDSGADYENIAGINYKLAMDLEGVENIPEIKLIAHQAFQAHMNNKPVRSLRGHKIIKQVKQYIVDNYAKQLTLESIAKVVHISPFYLSHLFKEVEGLSVIDFLTKVRMENAKVLLRESNYSIHEVSIKLGYNDSSYFTKVFRRKEGRTPSQFRKLG